MLFIRKGIAKKQKNYKRQKKKRRRQTTSGRRKKKLQAAEEKGVTKQNEGNKQTGIEQNSEPSLD